MVTFSFSRIKVNKENECSILLKFKYNNIEWYKKKCSLWMCLCVCVDAYVCVCVCVNSCVLVWSHSAPFSLVYSSRYFIRVILSSYFAMHFSYFFSSPQAASFYFFFIRFVINLKFTKWEELRSENIQTKECSSTNTFKMKDFVFLISVAAFGILHDQVVSHHQ